MRRAERLAQASRIEPGASLLGVAGVAGAIVFPGPSVRDGSALMSDYDVAMATIRLVTGEEREVPDNVFEMTERGVEYDDGETHHIVPWSAVIELIKPTSGRPTVAAVDSE
jgi:hypothetical protein